MLLLSWTNVRTVPTARARASSALARLPRSAASWVDTEVRSDMNPSTNRSLAARVSVSCDMFLTESNSGPLLSPKVCTACERLSSVSLPSLPLPRSAFAPAVSRVFREPFLLAPFGPSAWVRSDRLL